MPVYDNFEYFKAHLLRRIEFSKKERGEQYDKLLTKARNICGELTKKFADTGEKIITVDIDRRHVKFSPFTWTITNSKNLKNDIKTTLRVQINPCFDYPLPEEHHTKIWTIITNTTPIKLSGKALKEVFSLCRAKAEEVGAFVKINYVDTFQRTIADTDANFCFDIQHASLANLDENQQVGKELFDRTSKSNHKVWSRYQDKLNPILDEAREWNLSALQGRETYNDKSYYQRFWNLEDSAVLRVSPAETAVSISSVAQINDIENKKQRLHSILHPTTQQLNLQV